MDITHITDFLSCKTPLAWAEEAAQPANLPVLLADHANCELKAAQQAQAIMMRYKSGLHRAVTADAAASNQVYRPVESHHLLNKLSRLAREELRHFEQVIAIMKRRNVTFLQLSASRYAGGLKQNVRSQEPQRLVDILITGAIIEARSCERFAALAPRLDAELGEFYSSLLKSESRHFKDYLTLAEGIASPEEVADRLSIQLECERELIESPDGEFRFHSGTPLLK